MLSGSVQAPRDLDSPGLEVVDALLDDRVDRGARALLGVGPELGAVVASVRGQLHRGKQLRAAFCLWGARAVRGDAAVGGVGEAAAALEMFHLAALVHDDLMDRSDSRRGLATAHRDFAGAHRREGREGAAELFGTNAAVLVGDLCLTWSDDLFAAATAAAGPRATAARRVWEEMRTQVLAGQYLDLLAQGRPATTARAATAVLHYKSAKYTIEHPLRLGATLAGADDALLDAFADYGLQLGEAFQLRDDVLGVLGDPDVTGKSAHDDVREGKRTLLVALAEERATASQRAVLRRHLGDPDLDEDGLDAVRAVLTDTGALDRVEARIAFLAAGAHQVLDEVVVDAPARVALDALTDVCAWRSA